jgi:hypothetical protein
MTRLWAAVAIAVVFTGCSGSGLDADAGGRDARVERADAKDGATKDVEPEHPMSSDGAPDPDASDAGPFAADAPDSAAPPTDAFVPDSADGDASSADARADAPAEATADATVEAGRDAGSDSSSTPDAPGERADGAADGPAETRAEPHNFVFVTSTKVLTFLLTTSAADSQCATAAAAAKLPGQYRAWMSSSTTDARAALAGARGWVRTDGLPFVDTVDDLTAGRLLSPPLTDETGHILAPMFQGEYVATGTKADGTRNGTVCHDWTDNAAYIQHGYPDGTTYTWTSGVTASCTAMAHLYCFGVSLNTPLTVVPAQGRLSFLTQGTLKPGGGVAAADALCAQEAVSASLAGTFKALLATSTASAASRFAADGVRVRLDGIPLNVPGQSLFGTSAWLTTLNVTSTRGYEGNWGVWAGAHDLGSPGTKADSCQDWQVQSTAQTALIGNSSSIPRRWDGGYPTSCDYPGRFYCLQQ